jgi:predicted deacylase
MWFHQVMLNPGGRSRKRLRAPQKREVTEMTNPGLCETRLATALRDHPLRIFNLTGARAGPVLALIGAVHGDELEGPLTLSALMQSLESRGACRLDPVFAVRRAQPRALFSR